MPSISYDALTSAEREELALCGITSAEQLSRCSAEDLLRDWENLKRFFPHRVSVLTERRIRAISGLAEETEEKGEDEFSLPQREELTPAALFKHKKNLREKILQEEAAAGLGTMEREQRSNGHLSAAEKLERMHGLSKHFHAIRCSHPGRVYFGALATLLLLVPFFALLTIPVMILTGDLEGGKPIYYGAAFAALVLPWLLIARRAECGVCHIPLYKFGNYPHNRSAHHLPLLGYTFTTALHIIFLFWFRCPACGTQLKLSPRSSRHHHH